MQHYHLRIRRLSAPPSSYRRLSESELEDLVSDCEAALTGDHWRDEIQACSIRIWRLFRTLDIEYGGSGKFARFARAIDESPTAIAAYFLGKDKPTRYNTDVLHRWCCGISSLWLEEFGGPQVDLHLRADGVVRPFLVHMSPLGVIKNAGEPQLK